MAYTIVKSDGTVLTTIADGTINTTSTSLGLPGRNYAGYGQSLDTNFVHITENFADSSPPPNPLRGQLWYNTNANTLYVCPSDGQSNAAAWTALALSGGNATTTFGSVNVTGNLTANNVTALNSIVADTITVRLATVTANANIANAAITSADVGTLNTQLITTGSPSTPGTIIGTWTANGGGIANGFNGTTLWVTNGNLMISGGSNVGVKTDYYYYANGTPINFGGNYSNSNVASYLLVYGGNINASAVTLSTLTTGSNVTPGNITGNWTLTTGSTLNLSALSTGSSLNPGTITGAWSVNPGSSLTLTSLTTGSSATAGTITGAWTINPGSSLTMTTITTGSSATAGTITGAWTINPGSSLTMTSLTTGANTTAGTITGNWTLSSGSRLQATYADLAERFEADISYDAGTVVEIGGDKEITAVKYELSEDVFGVVSETAAYLMNAGAGSDLTHPAVAVNGRVKVKVVGKIKKGQRLVAAGNGLARGAKTNEANAFNTIGRSLENKSNDDIGIVEAFVKIN